MARRYLGLHTRGFAGFEGFYISCFRLCTQIIKSAMFTNFITPGKYFYIVSYV
ncbi:hypothetical protein MYVALT_H_00040 (plasmid) [Candidatus Vallotia tarda]|uniref:Uncharacterized protein n=1 Tax=Candidatus Vallotiella hemipterorum TaxID=1177213 RepID=A0A8D9CCG7_9BURK|nr:hypothetical protein VALLOT_H_00040 [Candidatus Vallotia tarda]CAG7605190.1 hypothetical protein MYVALT_H_00040 [Candidatus Vallotia tarda]